MGHFERPKRGANGPGGKTVSRIGVAHSCFARAALEGRAARGVLFELELELAALQRGAREGGSGMRAAKREDGAEGEVSCCAEADGEERLSREDLAMEDDAGTAHVRDTDGDSELAGGGKAEPQDDDAQQQEQQVSRVEEVFGINDDAIVPFPTSPAASFAAASITPRPGNDSKRRPAPCLDIVTGEEDMARSKRSESARSSTSKGKRAAPFMYKSARSPMSTSTLTAPETAVEDMDEELEDILGRVDACAKLSRSLISEHDSTRHGRGITEDADTLLRRSLDVSMELQMVAARFSAMWGSQVRARVGPEGWPRDASAASVSAAEAARSRRLSLGKATKAVQKCFEAEREGLLREIRALEARNRKCGLTIRGLETRKEREEHLAKRCRTLQERVDDGRANLDAVKRQLERSQTHAADTDRVRHLLEDEVVQLRREKQELDARLEAQEHEAARTLREQTRQLARDLEAEREAHAAARESWHQSKLEADLIRRQVDIKESALREKDRHAEEAGDILRETTGTLRTKLKQAENRAFAAEDAIAGARAEADGVRAELTEQLNDLRAKLARTEDLRQDAVLETRDLREQLARRHSGSEDTDTLSLQRQVARLCEANTALRAERDRAERTSERALGALRQARLLEETVSQLRAQIRDRDETIHQLTVHYRSPEQHEQLAIVAAESSNLTTMNDAPSCTGGDAVDLSFTLSP